MNMNTTLREPGYPTLASLLRVIRGFAEASVVAIAFALAILIVGGLIALLVGGLHASLSWLAILGA